MLKYFRPFIKFLYYKYYFPIDILAAIIRTKIFGNFYKKFEEYKGDVDLLLRQKLCIFSHFDKNGIIDDYVIFYLKHLYELGCATIIVSTALNLRNEDIIKVKPYVSYIIKRQNIGMDFGSYSIGFNFIKHHTHFNLLIFANDSVYGPFSSLNSLFNLINEENCDMAGVTDSFEHSYHLQSYLLLFSKKVFNNKNFINFFQNFIFSNNKRFVIKYYEIGISKLLIKKGFRLKALCNYLEVSLKYFNTDPLHKTKIITKPLNSTHHFWKILIESFNYPFIKRQLLRDNPQKIKNIESWREIVSKTNYDIKLIENHLNQHR